MSFRKTFDQEDRFLEKTHISKSLFCTCYSKFQISIIRSQYNAPHVLTNPVSILTNSCHSCSFTSTHVSPLEVIFYRFCSFKVKFVYTEIHSSQRYSSDRWIHSSRTPTGLRITAPRLLGRRGDPCPPAPTTQTEQSAAGVTSCVPESHSCCCGKSQPPEEAGDQHNSGLSWLGQGPSHGTGFQGNPDFYLRPWGSRRGCFPQLQALPHLLTVPEKQILWGQCPGGGRPGQHPELGTVGSAGVC